MRSKLRCVARMKAGQGRRAGGIKQSRYHVLITRGSLLVSASWSHHHRFTSVLSATKPITSFIFHTFEGSFSSFPTYCPKCLIYHCFPLQLRTISSRTKSPIYSTYSPGRTNVSQIWHSARNRILPSKSFSIDIISIDTIHLPSQITPINTFPPAVLRWRNRSIQSPHPAPILPTPTKDLPHLLQHPNRPTRRPRPHIPRIPQPTGPIFKYLRHTRRVE